MRLIPVKNSPDKDIVMTPKELAQEILDHFKPSGSVLDPCCGNGAFTIDKWCEISKGKNFFDWNEKVDWIITNPPWSKFKEFLEHGMKIADNIVYLVTINHFLTKARLRLIKEHGFGIKEFFLVDTPKSWPQSGFQVAAGHIQKGYVGSVKGFN